jgi:sugar lactone lactonase YvrE
MAASLIAITLVGTLAVTATPAAASGVTYQPRDLVASQDNATVLHYSPIGTLLDSTGTGVPASGGQDATGSCFDAANDLYVTNFSAGTVSKFDSTGTRLGYPWATGFNSYPESCVVDASGNIYVGSTDPGDLRKFSPSGTLIATFAPVAESRGVDWIDLAPDGCTLSYTSEGTGIHRFNVCTGPSSRTSRLGCPPRAMPCTVGPTARSSWPARPRCSG